MKNAHLVSHQPSEEGLLCYVDQQPRLRGPGAGSTHDRSHTPAEHTAAADGTQAYRSITRRALVLVRMYDSRYRDSSSPHPMNVERGEDPQRSRATPFSEVAGPCCRWKQSMF